MKKDLLLIFFFLLYFFHIRIIISIIELCDLSSNCDKISIEICIRDVNSEMSPLNTNPSVPVYDNTKKNSTTDINIEPMEQKIMYQRSEMEQLRYAINTPLNLQDNPQLGLVARINFMPQFAANLMPNHVPIPDGRYAHVNRRHVPHANGHDFSSNNGRSMNKESAINQRLSRIQINIPREVKLREAENAWKPSVMKKNDSKDVEDDGTEEILRGVRCILNKLTTTNFDVMLEQFQELNIDTIEKVNAVTSMVFCKAVNEPNFSTGYAVLCKHLSVCLADEDTERPQLKFKRSLIVKCQQEFDQNVADEKSIDRELQPLKDKLKACPKSNIEQINNIKTSIVEEESNIRRRLVSTVRFIGELYKMDMLTTNIMAWCIKSLIDSGSEDKLECLCKLLTTIGSKLEKKPSSDKDKRYLNLTEYFKQLKKIVDRKVPKINVSTRVRFMIMDLIDLRNLNWKPKSAVRN